MALRVGIAEQLDASRPRPVPLPHLVAAVLGAPVAWSLHLPAVYLVVTVGCATGWPGTEGAVGVLTALLALTAAGAGMVAWRWWRRVGVGEGGARGPWSALELGVHRFLLLLGLAAAPLFLLVIVLGGVSPLFVPACP